MNKHEMDFDTWFDIVKVNVLDMCGVEFRDTDSVRADYDDGLDAVDVAQSIADEYQD
jgi:hypothetical protein